MYGLNDSDGRQSIFLNPDSGATVDPRAEFASRLETITPTVMFAPGLVSVNVFVFMLMIVSGVKVLEPTTASLIEWGANYGPRTVSDGQWWRLATSMYLHVGLIHLAFNMFVLWKAGDFIERLLGNFGFLLIYTVSGLGGALASVAWHPYVVSAGASGAIFGLYGALLGYVLVQPDTVPGDALSPLTKNALIFVGYNLVFGAVTDGIDLADHIGGLVTGFACGLIVAVPLEASPPPRRALRNATVLAGMGILFSGIASKLPRPADVMAEINSFAAVEREALTAYRSDVAKVQSEHLSDDNLADLIEKDVLPEWQRENLRLAALKGLPQPAQASIAAILNYMDIRQQGWVLMVQGLRKHDVKVVNAGNAKELSAQMLATQMALQSASRKP